VIEWLRRFPRGFGCGLWCFLCPLLRGERTLQESFESLQNQLGEERFRFDLLRGIVIGLMEPAEALCSSGQIEAGACSGLA
jgi:hypothetical protein